MDEAGCAWVALEISRLWQLMQVKGLDKFCEIAVGQPDIAMILAKSGISASLGAESNVMIDPCDEVLSEVTQLGARTHISIGKFPQKTIKTIIRALGHALFVKIKESVHQVEIGLQFTLAYNWDVSPGMGKSQGIDHISDIRSTEEERLGANSPEKQGRYGLASTIAFAISDDRRQYVDEFLPDCCRGWT